MNERDRRVGFKRARIALGIFSGIFSQLLPSILYAIETHAGAALLDTHTHTHLVCVYTRWMDGEAQIFPSAFAHSYKHSMNANSADSSSFHSTSYVIFL